MAGDCMTYFLHICSVNVHPEVTICGLQNVKIALILSNKVLTDFMLRACLRRSVKKKEKEKRALA